MPRSILSLVAVAVLSCWAGGCAKDHPPTADRGGATMTSATGDVCPHCPGVQKATADGKCEQCLMPVSAPGTVVTMNDACPVCPGQQTATADGKCPICGRPAVVPPTTLPVR
ncbi:MAG TPA: hypothetical protein VF796_19380 [Humisphaera sp.]